MENAINHAHSTEDLAKRRDAAKKAKKAKKERRGRYMLIALERRMVIVFAASDIRLLYWNMRSLRTKIDLLRGFLSGFPLINLQETFFTAMDRELVVQYLPASHTWKFAGGLLMGVDKRIRIVNYRSFKNMQVAVLELFGENWCVVNYYKQHSIPLTDPVHVRNYARQVWTFGVMRTVTGGDYNLRLGALCNAISGRVHRATMDPITDPEGKVFAKLLRPMEMTVLNGNTMGDETGQITWRNPANLKGTVIDYTTVSNDALPYVYAFEIYGHPVVYTGPKRWGQFKETDHLAMVTTLRHPDAPRPAVLKTLQPQTKVVRQ